MSESELFSFSYLDEQIQRGREDVFLDARSRLGVSRIEIRSTGPLSSQSIAMNIHLIFCFLLYFLPLYLSVKLILNVHDPDTEKD